MSSYSLYQLENKQQVQLMGNQFLSYCKCCEKVNNNQSRDQISIGNQDHKISHKSALTINQEPLQEKRINPTVEEGFGKQSPVLDNANQDIRKMIKRNLQLQPFIFQQQEKKSQIFLNIDQKWCSHMSDSEKDPLQIGKIYRLMSTQIIRQGAQQRKIYQRSTHDNKKIHLIFKHHIPMLGQYYFQVELISIIPSKRCQFTIGIVDYHKAVDKVHSRDGPYQQSYTYSERFLDISRQKQKIPMILNMRFKVEVTRQSQPFIAFYINDQLKRKQPLRNQFNQNAIVLAPYLQMQYQGTVFALKIPVQKPHSLYKLSTIMEQQSAISSISV